MTVTMTEDTLGYGTKLQTKVTSGSSGSVITWPEIAEITDVVGGPSKSRDSVETTNHQSPDGYREFVPGLKDGGDVTFSMNYLADDISHVGLQAQIDDELVHDYRIIYPGQTSGWAFKGFPTKLDVKAAIDKLITADVTLKISGKPIYGALA